MSRRVGTISEYFYDSYAILAGLTDRRLRPYLRAGRGVTTWLNLMEVYYALLRDGKSEETAREVVRSGRGYLLEFSLDDVLDAMALRLRWRRRGKDISYVDAIGFHLAQNHRLSFLTGDPVFRHMRGVTFVRSRSSRETGKG